MVPGLTSRKVPSQRCNSISDEGTALVCKTYTRRTPLSRPIPSFRGAYTPLTGSIHGLLRLLLVQKYTVTYNYHTIQ